MAKNLSKENINYWAGFFDGEGSIFIERYIPKKTAKHKGIRFWLRVSVTNTNKEIMMKLHKTFGGSLLSRQRYETSKLEFNWNLNSRQALVFIKMLLPFLIVKKRQAKLALSFYENYKRLKLPEKQKELKRRNKMYEKFRKINKRGK